MKVLFAVDGSDYTRRALDYVAAHDWLRAKHGLCVFNVVQPLPHRAAALAGPNLTHRYYEDDAQVVLSPVRERLDGADVKADYEWVLGHPGEAIARKADQGGFDLVVMGSHGHGAFAAAVLGSVATRVLAGCRVPVLLIR
jgi:nucleotide-binding universal stress UspA family protein